MLTLYEILDDHKCMINSITKLIWMLFADLYGNGTIFYKVDLKIIVVMKLIIIIG